MVEGASGSYVTSCIDNRDCVFVHYDGDVAKCSLERAYEDGKTDWRKPLSCHMFPLRIRPFGKDFVRYEQINECQAGREKGSLEGVKLYDFLRVPLIRKYGEAWYGAFLNHCQTLL